MNVCLCVYFADILDLDDFSGMKKKKKKKKKPYDMEGLEEALQVGIFRLLIRKNTKADVTNVMMQ